MQMIALIFGSAAMGAATVGLGMGVPPVELFVRIGSGELFAAAFFGTCFAIVLPVKSALERRPLH